MAKTNYRRSRSRQYSNKRSPSSSGAKWVVVGMLVGALGMFFLWPQSPHSSSANLLLSQHEMQHKLAPKKHLAPAPVAHKSKVAEYDFYTMLPKMEVKAVENRPLVSPPTPAALPVQPMRAVVPQPVATTAAEKPTVVATAAPPRPKPQEPAVQLAEVAPAPPVSSPVEKPKPVVNEKTAEKYTVQVANVRDYAEADRLKAELTMLGFDVSLQDYTVNGQTWNRVLAGSFSTKQAAMQQQKRLKQSNIRSTLIKD